jgi:uncharacterized membrane protein YbaN (DUF454 family)
MKRLTAHAARLAWLATGIVALAIGAIGVVLPLLPTTPFILVAAFAFAQSSQRLHTWLLNHNIFGGLIANWRRYGAISRTAKITGVLSMAAVLAISLLLDVPVSLLVLQALVLSACAYFIVSRPLPPDDRKR